MTFVTDRNGTQSANALPRSSDKSAPRQIKAQSLADVLACLNQQPNPHVPMLRTTAAKIAAFLARSVDDLSLDLIHANREGFRPFLESQHYKEGSVRSYVNYLRMLLQAAEDLGWRPFENLSPEWKPVLEVAQKNKCVSLVKLIAQAKSTPQGVTQEDLEHWVELTVKQGMRYGTAQSRVNAVWRSLVACGYTQNAPPIFLRKKKYGVPLSEFPPTLRDEVIELLRWKSADFEPERPKGAKIRKVSANSVRRTFGSLYGYATKIAGFGDVGSLQHLMQKRIIAGYVSWCINEQKAKGTSLLSLLGAVLAAVSQHPDHKALDLTWFRPLLDTVPVEPYENVKARKAKKYLDYDVLASVPAKISARRNAEATRGEEHRARLVMEQLMISWLLVFPWRQRNLRECRVSGANPNLFKSRVPDFSSIDKPDWALKAEAEDPDAEFWQVNFSPEETKTGVAVHSLVPKQLITLLEEYLSEYRPILLKASKLETLFVSPEGNPLRTSQLTELVSDLTLRYAGRRVTPHLFRDVVAFAWLKAHRADYLTLSKMLWHKNVKTTIDYYANRFNDSSAVVAMESWLEERGSGAKHR